VTAHPSGPRKTWRRRIVASVRIVAGPRIIERLRIVARPRTVACVRIAARLRGVSRRPIASRPRVVSHLRIALPAALALAASACAVFSGSPRVPPLPADARVRPADFVVVTVRNVARPLAERAGSTPRGYDDVSAYGVTAAASQAVRALERTYGLEQVSAWPIATLHVHCIVFRLPASAGRAALLARLARDPRIESAQPLNEFSAESDSNIGASAAHPLGTARAGTGAQAEPAGWMPYNDPYAPLQRSLRELDVIDAHRASRGAGVRIAIIDTGVDWKHPDLEGRVVLHRNFVDGDERQFLRDRHGTEVAGVIAAVANNGIGIVGIAPEARLLAFKACWQAGDAPQAFCNSFTLAQGLEAAILAHADIVNLSLAGPRDPLLTRLVREGERQGMLFTGAVALPEGPTDDGLSTGDGFPTGVPGVLPVQSAEDGAGREGYLLAPGREILTLTPGGHYDFASGSSLATAEVSGILALLIANGQRLSAAQAARALGESARNAGSPGVSMTVNACRALIEARGRGACRDGPGSIADVKARTPETR